MKPILIVAGGTGGHLSPGTALASHLNRSSVPVEFLSLYKNENYPDLKNAGYPVHFYGAPTLAGKRVLLFPFLLIRAMFRAWPVVRKSRALVLMGGFPCLPAGLLGLLLRKPIYLCEQNAVMGRANRLFARFAKNVFLNFPLTGRNHSPEWKVVGNPLRASFLNLELSGTDEKGRSSNAGSSAKNAAKKSNQKLVAAKSRTGKKSTTSFPAGKGKKILVAGGSQGAVQINKMVLDLYNRDPVTFGKFSWVLQAGLKNEAEMKALFRDAKNLRVIGFDPEIHRFYREADLIICRSGAGVLTEAFLFGLPMILIPYPYATDSHQRENAFYAKLAGAAKVIDTRDSDCEQLRQSLLELKATDLKSMARSSAGLAKPQASETILNAIEKELN